MKIWVFFSLVFGICLADPLPDLPQAYTTRVQANVVDKARLADGRLGEGAGLSVSFLEAVEGNEKAYLHYDAEIVVPGGDHAFVFGESVIWNKEINGIKNYLSIAIFGAPSAPEALFCTADNLHENSLISAIMGIGGNSFPSIAHMLHFGPGQGYVEGEKAMVNGIPCRTFNSHITITEAGFNGTFSVIYYWSEQYDWTSTAGTNVSVPVQAIITGEEIMHNGVPKFIEVFFEFTNFMIARPSYQFFLPPSDLWCAGRELTESIPGVPEFYSFTSEAIFYYDPPLGDHHATWVVSTRQEYYDYLMKVSRTDYKPIDFSNLDDPYAGDDSGFVNEVKDFTSGLKFRTYQKFGNCSIHYIGLDSSGDITINPDGTIDMLSPTDMWGSDKKYAVNGIFEERGIDMKSYVTMEARKGAGEEPYINFTTAIWFSEGRTAIVGNEDPQYHVPVKIEKYDANRYNDRRMRTKYNIIGFRNGEPDFNLFDVTACFGEEMVAHKMLKLGYDSNFDIYQGLKIARDQVRKSVTEAAKITPIRVQNIEMFQEPDQNALYVLFSITDYPQGIVPDESQLPEESKRPLSEALDNLYSAVSGGTFKVELPTINGVFGALYADSNYFETVDRTQPSNPKANPNEIYTPGAMAGLGIAMLLLAFVGGVALLVFVLKW